jgi:hypothetical protein
VIAETKARCGEVAGKRRFDDALALALAEVAPKALAEH